MDGRCVAAVLSVVLAAGVGPAAEPDDEGKQSSRVVVTVDGGPAENMQVQFVFQNTLAKGVKGPAVTKIFRTNAAGAAIVRHSPSGQVHVVVMGEWMSHGTEGPAPGVFRVELSTHNPRHDEIIAKWQRLRKAQAAPLSPEPAGASQGVSVFGPRPVAPPPRRPEPPPEVVATPAEEVPEAEAVPPAEESGTGE
jgi:hypothetical protein